MAEQKQKAPDHEGLSIHDWCFEDSPHVGAYTTKRIMNGDDPITRVFHDSDDGAWQFHGPEESKVEDAVLVCLHCIVERDSSIKELADLPQGWCAWRDDASSAWQRAEQEHTDDEER